MMCLKPNETFEISNSNGASDLSIPHLICPTTKVFFLTVIHHMGHYRF